MKINPIARKDVVDSRTVRLGNQSPAFRIATAPSKVIADSKKVKMGNQSPAFIVR